MATIVTGSCAMRSRRWARVLEAGGLSRRAHSGAVCAGATTTGRKGQLPAELDAAPGQMNPKPGSG